MLTKSMILLGLFTTVIACAPSEFNAASLASTTVEVTEENSSMNAVGPFIADGITQVQIQLSLRDKNNKGVKGVQMALSSSGTNNVLIPCTHSDEDGQSKCHMMTTTPEWKTIKAIGAFTLETKALFISAPPTTTLFSFVSAGNLQTAPSGHVFLTNAGATESPSTLNDSSGTVRVRTTNMATMIDAEAL